MPCRHAPSYTSASICCPSSKGATACSPRVSIAASGHDDPPWDDLPFTGTDRTVLNSELTIDLLTIPAAGPCGLEKLVKMGESVAAIAAKDKVSQPSVRLALRATLEGIPVALLKNLA